MNEYEKSLAEDFWGVAGLATFHMRFEGSRLSELLVAVLARVGPGPRVGPHVPVDTGLLVKSFLAYGTKMRVLLGMMLLVKDDGVTIGKTAIEKKNMFAQFGLLAMNFVSNLRSKADITLESLPLAMLGHMLLQVGLSGEGFGAELTFEISDLVVDAIHVDFEIVQSLERLAAEITFGPGLFVGRVHWLSLFRRFLDGFDVDFLRRFLFMFLLVFH